MLINLGLALFVLTLITGALASADLTPMAHDLAAFFFVLCGAASTLLIAIDVVLAFITAHREAEPGGTPIHHH